jgi:hypothetical protein
MKSDREINKFRKEMEEKIRGFKESSEKGSSEKESSEKESSEKESTEEEISHESTGRIYKRTPKLPDREPDREPLELYKIKWEDLEKKTENTNILENKDKIIILIGIIFIVVMFILGELSLL